MYTKASIITLFAGLAAAQIHAPVGEPSGNPITRPLNEVVPTCEQFTITWQPTTPNTVSVLLLKGPSTNVVKFGPSLAEGIANSGSLSWTPAADLEATSGPNGYGIQIIDDVTGQYQYSTQFGISAGNCEDDVSSSTVALPTPEPTSVDADSTSSTAPTSTPSDNNDYDASKPVATSTPVPHSSHVYSSEAPYPTTAVPPPAYTNGTTPTGSMSIQPSASANATTSRLPEATANSASGVHLGFAGVAAAMMALVL